MSTISKSMSQTLGNTTATTTTKLVDNGCNMIPANGPFGNKTIGPRTVIVPADPIIWNEGTSYPYLSLVATEDFGSSYISKKDVPSGTPLTDTDYWIKTGDFNAQLGQIQNDITKLNSLLPFSVTNFGADINDPSTLQSALDKIAEVSNIAYIPAGVWKVTTAINVPVGIQQVVGDGRATVIEAQSALPYIMYFNPNNGDYGNNANFMGIDGIKFKSKQYDATGQTYAQCGVTCNAQVKFFNCSFENLICGIKPISNDRAWGITVQSCRFVNGHGENDMVPDSTAVICGTDSQIADTIIWGFTYGIKNAENQSLGNTFLNNVYFWNFRLTKHTYAIYQSPISGSPQYLPSTLVMVNSCYFDQISYITTDVGIKATGCVFLYGNEQTGDKIICHTESGITPIPSSTFSDCALGNLSSTPDNPVRLCDDDINQAVSKIDFELENPNNYSDWNDGRITVPCKNLFIDIANGTGKDYFLGKLFTIKTANTNGSFIAVKIREYGTTPYRFIWLIIHTTLDGSENPDCYVYSETLTGTTFVGVDSFYVNRSVSGSITTVDVYCSYARRFIIDEIITPDFAFPYSIDVAYKSESIGFDNATREGYYSLPAFYSQTIKVGA